MKRVWKSIAVSLILLFLMSLISAGVNASHMWIEDDKILASDSTQTDLRLGENEVDISGNYIIAGAEGLNCSAILDCGAAYIFFNNNGTWLQQARLLSSDPENFQYFGRHVAIDGNTAVVGNELEDCPMGVSGSQCGAVYVYYRTGSTWALQQKIRPNVPISSSQFGKAVDISGNTLVVGTPNYSQSCSFCGAVYVFDRSGTTWSQTVILQSSLQTTLQDFGIDVAIDGNTIGVSTSRASAGYATVFVRNSGIWSEQQRLTPSVLSGDDQPFRVDVSGNYLIVGAPGKDCPDPAWDGCGAAYIFFRSSGVWTEQQLLRPLVLGAFDNFGHEVSIDGNIAVASAPGLNCNGGTGGGLCGGVFVFERNGVTWQQVDIVQAADVNNVDELGQSVQLDGNTIVAGTYKYNCPGANQCGVLYTFVQTQPLNVTAACNGPNLNVTITAGDGPFNITASAGVNTPKLGVGIGTTTINGPEKWDDLTVTELGGNTQSINYGQFRCRSTERPAPLMPAHGTHTTNTSPLFSWTAITDANNYRLFVFDDANVATRTVDIRQNSGGPTQLTPSTPLPTMRLFWRVRGRQNRLWSLWSVRFTLFVDPVVAAPSLADSTPIPSSADGSLPPNNRSGITPAPTIAAPPPTQLPPPPNSR